MQRCLDLAALGKGTVSPNPMVGAVIVHDGKLISEAYHHRAGEAHAEAAAISKADKNLLKESELYVSLEPCSHFGKTPPCADLIIRHEIPRVIVAMEDPNPQVAGRGIQKLKDAGIQVISGVLREQAEYLNRRFICYHKRKRPYIILKWAKTLDGFMDFERDPRQEGKAAWITNKICKSLVHKWRTEEDAFMIGTHTAVKDNPRLTVREWTGRNPLRISIDKEMHIPENYHIKDKNARSIIFTHSHEEHTESLSYIALKDAIYDLSLIMQRLYDLKIQSLMVEGGAELLKSFISIDLWDEARIFTGEKEFGRGVKAPYLVNAKQTHTENFGNSRLEIMRPGT